MKRIALFTLVLAALLPAAGFAQTGAQTGPYKVLRTVKVGGEGGFDYITADSDERKLYVARSGPAGHIAVYNLDTLAPAGDIPGVSAHGVTIDARYHHAFASSKPVAMFDSKTLAMIKTIDVQGNPDGYLTDSFNDRVYILSHAQPNATVLDAKDGTILGTIDLGGAPEQGVSDSKGFLFFDIEDKSNIAVVDAKTMQVVAHYDVSSQGGGCAGLAMDAKNHLLFATCRDKNNMIVLAASPSADMPSGQAEILTALPTGQGSDGATFNPATVEAFSSQGDGTLTIVKESGPRSFAVEQTLTTLPRAKTITLDTKTGHLFLVTAEFGPPPPPAPDAPSGPGAPINRRTRAPMIPGSFSILEVGR